jgi:hypothetical protein
MEMNKIASLFCLMSLLICCGPKQAQVEKIIEDGVEVILNHLEPYKVTGEPSNLVLEEELRIDFEKPEFEESGLREPDYVDADSMGNIYVVDRRRVADYFIMKFEKNGKFIKDIGRKGQGPGEIQGILFIKIDSKDQILVSDGGNRKILVLDGEGNLVSEMKLEPQWFKAIPLDNGNYLVESREWDGVSGGLRLAIFNSDLTQISDLDFFSLPHLTSEGKNTYTIPTFYWRVRNGNIYVGNEQRGYEIWKYDLNGKLLLKIRKEYIPVKYPEDYRKATMEIIKNNPQVGLLDHMPPLNSFFIDDENRLLVMTYESGDKNEEYMHDIFDEEGVFIGKKSIGLSYAVTRSLLPRRTIAKNNRLYRLRYKENGFVELIVYRMTWE